MRLTFDNVSSTSSHELEEGLRARVEAGAAAWPALALDRQAFVSHLHRHAGKDGLPPLEHAAEMWLACACVCGVDGAAATFIRNYQTVVERAAGRIEPSLRDDVTQIVLMSLLLPAARPSALAQYAGRSRLSTWLTALTIRATFRQRTALAPCHADSASDTREWVGDALPEAALTRARYGAHFDAALRRAIAESNSRERTLLRLHHARGWSIDRLASLYGVGRSTTARWLIQARESLYARTRGLLMETLGITGSEFQSMARALGDDLETSLLRLLDEDGA